MSDDTKGPARDKRTTIASLPEPTPAPRKRTGGGRGRRFEKGNRASVGKGRPKRDEIIDLFFEGVVRGETKDGKPFEVERRVALLERLYASAMNIQRKDHTRLMEIATAYAFGKPRERLEMSGPGGKPIESSDATPSRRKPTTGELRKRMQAILDKRDQFIAARAASNGHSNGTNGAGNGAHAAPASGETEEP